MSHPATPPVLARLRLLSAVTAAFTLVGLLAAIAAHAGTYEYNSCHLPSGAPASTDGWRSSVQGPQSASNTCASTTGGLFGRISPGALRGDNATWTFSAPTNTSITAITYNRSASIDTHTAAFGGPQYILATAPVIQDYEYDEVPEQCTAGASCSGLPAGTSTFALKPTSYIFARVSCPAGPPPATETCPDADAQTSVASSSFTITRAAITLQDNTAPTVSSVSGDLTTATTLSGTKSLTFTANDKGGGLQRARIYVNGTVASDQLVDGNDGKCVAPYAAPVPCKLDATPTVSLDTTPYQDGGTFKIRADVVDVAGNVTEVLPERSVVIDNTPPCLTPANQGGFLNGTACNPALKKNTSTPNGQGATLDSTLSVSFLKTVSSPCKLNAAQKKAQAKARAKAKAKRKPYKAPKRKICKKVTDTSSLKVTGSDRPSLHGKLTTKAGAPIAGAAIALARTVDGTPGSRMFTTATTDAAGNYSAKIPAGQPSGTVKAYYFPSSADNQAVTSGDVGVRVAASVSLKAYRSGAHKVGFSGTVKTLSSANVAVALQVREKGKWRTFRQARAKGFPAKFASTFKFTSAPASASFAFRAVVIRQSGLPYDFGSSRTVTVKVR